VTQQNTNKREMEAIEEGKVAIKKEGGAKHLTISHPPIYGIGLNGNLKKKEKEPKGF